VLLGLSSPLALAKADFYINLGAGMGMMDATTYVADQKQVDNGGDYALAILRAGWGTTFTSGAYIGLEAGGAVAQGRSRLVVNGVGYSHEINGFAEIMGRIGWETRGNSLFFVRAGTIAMFTNQGTDWMPAVGMGAEVPFAPRWRARIEVTYAWTDREKREHLMAVAGVVREF
jgi:hypothetical protein